MSANPLRAVILEEVRAMMARRRISQNVLAARAEIAKSTLGRRMIGESDFTIGELYRIATVLDTKVHDLITAESRA